MIQRITIRCNTQDELRKRIEDSESRGMRLKDKGKVLDAALRTVHWARLEWDR